MKAFLSHSSLNKDFVAAVAKELGRQFCVFDQFTFQSAVEFKRSIEQGLDDSNLFVLFASQESLNSIWVEFEIDEAFYRKLQKRIDRVLVLRLGDGVPLQKLAEWLRRAKIVTVNSPNHAAREIRLQFNDLLRSHQHQLFVGRTKEFASAESVFLPSDGSIPPRFVAFTGLPEIGRRSLAGRVAASSLGFKTIVQIPVESGDDLRDLTFKLAVEIEPFAGAVSLARIQKSIDALNQDELVKRGHDALKDIVESGALPLFVDRGGLTDENGSFAACFNPLFKSLVAANDVYIIFITSRKPLGTGSLHCPIIRVPPLTTEDSKKLLQGIAGREGVILNAKQLSELADYVCGYPPSCHYAIQLIKAYGVPVIFADKASLVDFRVSAFLAYLSRHTLTQSEKGILRLLANYSPLPLPVIGKFVDLTPELAASAIIRLIDFSLLLPDEEGNYQLADPLRDVVFKQSSFFTTSEHGQLAKSLNNWLDEAVDEPISLRLSRTIYRAAKQGSNKSLAGRVVHLTADIFQLAEEAYNHQNYDEAIEHAKKVLELRPGYDKAMILIVRAFAHLEQWAECEEYCSELERVPLPTRTTAFLRGFIERKRHRISEAIKQFELSKKAGRADVAVLRELAWCYYINGNVDRAEELVKEAFGLQPDNPFVIDIAIQVALAKNDYDAAKKQLERLRVFDTSGFYWHRMATFHSRFGDLESAVQAGLSAIDNATRPRFEALSHLAYCEIRLGRLDNAKTHLAQMDKHFPRLRRSIAFALNCHLELKSGNLEEVLRRISPLVAAGDRYLTALRSVAIKRLLSNPGLSEARSAELERELNIGQTQQAEEPYFEDLPKA